MAKNKKEKIKNKYDFTIVSNGIKTYLGNLKYYFTPLGTLFLGMILGISVLIPGVVSVLGNLAGNVKEIAGNVNLDVTALWNELVAEAQSLPLNSPGETLKILIGSDWFFRTLDGILQRLVADFETFAEGITGAVKSAVGGINTYLRVFFAFTVAGLVAGYFLTAFLVRRNTARRTVLKFAAACLLESLISSALISVSLWVTTLWKPAVFVSALIFMILFGFFSLSEAYLIHCAGKLKFKEIVNCRNLIMLFAADALIFLIAAAAAVIAIFITNVLAGVFIALPFAEIAFLVISMNAESYVLSVLKRRTVNIPDQPTATV